jgi:hypothetical protein
MSKKNSNDDLAARLKQERRLKELLQGVVEAHQSYFKELALKELGQSPQFITLDRLESARKAGRKGLVLVKARMHSDSGPFVGSLAIKSFGNKEEAIENRVRSELLAKRLEGKGVQTPRVLDPDEALEGDRTSSTLIYEGVDGVELLESGLSSEEQMHLAGHALGAFHGPSPSPVDIGRIEIIVNATIQTLPLQEHMRAVFATQGNRLAEEVIPSQTGGCLAFGDFHAGNLLVCQNRDKKPTTFLIDPEFLENESNACRFQDVGTFFVRSALEDFRTDRSLRRTFEDFRAFMKGYEEALLTAGGSLVHLYGSPCPWSTFYFQLGLSALLEALFIYRKHSKRIREDNSSHGSGDFTDRLTEEIALCLGLAGQMWSISL